MCVVAAGVLLSYALLSRPWIGGRGLFTLILSAAGVGGTLLVLLIPGLHTPWTGLVWTFLLLSILSVTFYLNLKIQLGPRKTAFLLGVRIFALALLVPMLFEPVLRYVARPKNLRPLAVLIDASGSMSVPDVQNGPTRVQAVWQTLRPQLPRLREHFVPRFFIFSTDLKELPGPESLADLQAGGQATDIARALAGVLAAEGRDDAAVLLFSDGIDNVSADAASAVRGGRRSVHTVCVGSEQAEPSALANIAVDNIETDGDFLVDHESPVKVTIKSTALANRVVDVQMMALDADGKPAGDVKSQKLVLQPLPEGQRVELPYKPAKVGLQRLAVWVDPIPGERSTVDNRQEFQGLALDPRIKTLYIEGRTRPEYRDLARALSRDPNIESATLLRIQQDRFTAGGTLEGKPFKALPQTLEEWKKFDVIILGDLDASFLSAASQSAIERTCADGAGLLMIGGQNSFGPGGYKNTPIEKALPVFVGELSAGQEKTQFVPRLTEPGALHPAMEGLAEWFGTAAGGSPARTLPPLRGNVVVPAAKSGAEVLLVHADRPGPDGRPQTVLAVQRYGKGRSAAFTADTTYLWYLPLRGMGQDSPYNRFWGQLVRWLAGEDVRNRQRGAGLEALMSKNLYTLGESVRVRAVVRDERGDATRYAQVRLVLRPAGAQPSANDRQIPLTPSESRTGLYEAIIPNTEKGDWIIELVANKEKTELGRSTLRFSVIPPADEMTRLAANRALLAGISEQTRGFSVALPQLPSLVNQLIRLDSANTPARQETVPLANSIRAILAWMGSPPQWPHKYDLPMQGLLVMILLTGEWFLRRRWQLP